MGKSYEYEYGNKDDINAVMINYNIIKFVMYSINELKSNDLQ